MQENSALHNFTRKVDKTLKEIEKMQFENLLDWNHFMGEMQRINKLAKLR